MAIAPERVTTQAETQCHMFSDAKHPGIVIARMLKQAGFNIETVYPNCPQVEGRDVRIVTGNQETTGLFRKILNAPETKAIWACQTGELSEDIGELLGQCDWKPHTRGKMEALFYINSAASHIDREKLEPDIDRATEHIEDANIAMDKAAATLPKGASFPREKTIKRLILRSIKTTMEKAGMNYLRAMGKYLEEELEPAPRY